MIINKINNNEYVLSFDSKNDNSVINGIKSVLSDLNNQDEFQTHTGYDFIDGYNLYIKIKDAFYKNREDINLSIFEVRILLQIFNEAVGYLGYWKARNDFLGDKEAKRTFQNILTLLSKK